MTKATTPRQRQHVRKTRRATSRPLRFVAVEIPTSQERSRLPTPPPSQEEIDLDTCSIASTFDNQSEYSAMDNSDDMDWLPQESVSADVRAETNTQRPAAIEEWAAYEEEETVAYEDLGHMDHECSHCRAKFWLQERLARSGSLSNPAYSKCCKKGSIKIPELSRPPQGLLALYRESKFFVQHIRSFNNAFAFASFGCTADARCVPRDGPRMFTSHGEVYHLIGSLQPATSRQAIFAQLYFLDPAYEDIVSLRHLNIMSYQRDRDGITTQPTMNADQVMTITTTLHQALDQCNPYSAIFRSARQAWQETNDRAELKIRLAVSREQDSRRYNLPTAEEVAVLLPGESCQELQERDIVLTTHDGSLRRISQTHPSYMALAYPLLFPMGDDGHHNTIITTDGRRLTPLAFYAYRMHVREHDDGGEILFRAGRLFQQLICDMFSCVEMANLNFLRRNQNKLRVDLYKALEDAVHLGDHDMRGRGVRCVLPSTFQGGARYMRVLYQDSMAIVRALGPPDYFITFTCNPTWPEITREAYEGQRAEDRADLVVRVFQQKLERLLDGLIEEKWLGEVIGHIYTIEFQKRGMPHAHLLIIVASPYKPRTAERVDRFVSAEIPDRLTHPSAFRSVTRQMVHGPCGPGYPKSPCMENGRCKYGYPKPFQESTNCNVDGYPLYRRPNNGAQFVTSKGRVVDNRWIVPHCLKLSVMFDAHINVEVCASISAVKYIHKYIFKGYDKATVEISSQQHSSVDHQPNRPAPADEISQYIDARYVSATEAAWRLFGIKMHTEKPSVYRLDLHLPGYFMVKFREDEDLLSVVDRSRDESSMLTAYFAFCTEALNVQGSITREQLGTYADFPRQHTFNKMTKRWIIRRRGDSVGRIFFVQPNAGELYYLRMLLHNVKGATSYQDIRSIQGELLPTFKDACSALGLLDNDAEWEICLREAALSQSGHQLRDLFVCILVFCSPQRPDRLWETFSDHLSDDLQPRRSSSAEELAILGARRHNMALQLLQADLEQHNKTLADYGLPSPDDEAFEVDLFGVPFDLALDPTLTADQVRASISERVATLSESQHRVYHHIMAEYDSFDAYSNDRPRVFFIDGPAGSGKTYIYSILLDMIRSDNHRAIAVAYSGIAALQLRGGRTAHSRFKIPFELDEDSRCAISPKSKIGDELRAARIIIWDEAPMAHRHAVEAVDRLLRDVMRLEDAQLENVAFGGKLILFGGDFRQIPPVVRRGGRADAVEASLKRSPIWVHVTHLSLTINMRLLSSQTGSNIGSQSTFASWLLDVGNGEAPGHDHDDGSQDITLPLDIALPPGSTVDHLIDKLYGDLDNHFGDAAYFLERAILCPRNSEMDAINQAVLERVQTPAAGPEVVYLSSDKLQPEYSQHEHLFSVEFLNSVATGSLPPHRLVLKIGTPIMLLRNLNPSRGLCNGTRLICRHFNKHSIIADILTGARRGEQVMLPRIPVTSPEHELTVKWTRRQFPVRPCFAMTINKSQGQTLNTVGIYLAEPVFSHGQLYVAISRATNFAEVFVLIRRNAAPPPDTEIGPSATLNVVYKELLSQ